jgi:type I restriction enzyme S subunit
MAKLGEVCVQITDGSHNPPSGVEQSEYLMLSSKNIDDDIITTDSPRFLSDSDYIVENKRTNVNEGDLLMTIVGTIGRVAIVPQELEGICLQRSVAVIKPNRKAVNNRYLMYQLQNMRPFLEKEARGVAQKGIYLKQVSQLDIKLPELEHQMQIVKVLDKASKLIFLRRQQLAKLDELVKARFVEMFGDPISNPFGFKVESLQEMLDDNAITYHLDGNHGSDYPRNEEFVESGVSYISANCIIDDNVNLQLAKHLTEERAAKLRKGIAQDEDVLFAHNATVGPVAILHTRETKVVLGTSLTAYRCNKQRILPSYLKAYMQSEGFVRQYTKDMKQTTRNQVPITAQRKYLFIVPPLSLQNRFASFVERIDQQKQTVQQSLEKLELMKKALMQEYFG